MINGLPEIRAYCGRKTLAGFSAGQKASIRQLAGHFNSTLAAEGFGQNLTQLLERTLSSGLPVELRSPVEALQAACRTGQAELEAFFMGEVDDETRTRFPTGNLAYRALAEVARCWDKWEPHAHFFASLSPDFVYHNIERRIAAGLETPAELRKNGLAEFLPVVEGGEIQDFFRKYSLRALSLFSPESFYAGIQNALWQHFMDGVTDLELRLPARRWHFPLATGIETACRAAGETERAAGKLLRRDLRTRFIFNVYQGEEYYGQKYPSGLEAEAAAAELIRLRASFGKEGGRIYGIDLALPHHFSSTDPAAFKPFEAAFGMAKQAGFLRTAHMNEVWKYGEEEMAALNCLASVFEMFDLDRVGHVLILDPFWINLAASPAAFSARREEVIADFRSRGIMIESCPATNSGQYDPTILRFGRHPFHSWLNEGMLDMVALAVDDPWILATSLSQVIARLLISNPDGLTFETVKTASSKRESGRAPQD